MKFAVIKKTSFIMAIISVFMIIGFTFLGKETGVYAFYSEKAKRDLPIYCVDRNDKKISISFDCAWGVDFTDKILEIMDEYNVKCTFFAVQFWAEKYPEYVKKIVDCGHEIGTHSKTHPQMSRLNEAKIIEELESSSKAIESITLKPVTLFRPPYGDYNDLLIKTARAMNLYTIQWDVDSLDWKDLSKDAISKRIISKTKSGSIILCHNNGLHTAEALPIIFSELIKQGYEFVPIGELIYKENYSVDPSGKQIKNNL